ncbi:MAG: response regulator [Mollicutes bacterium]|nr:response regulator [Mollicutes bacterium]
MNTIYIITGIMFTLLLILVFKIKKQNNLLSNSTYFILTLSLLVGYILELVMYFLSTTAINNIILEIYTKLYLIFIICWSSIFSVYTFLLSKKDDEYNKKIMILYALLTVTSSVAIIMLPLNITYTNRIILTGNAINFLKVLITCMLSVLYIRTVLSNKIINTIKANYIYVALIILTIVSFLEIKYQLNIVTTILLFITYLIFLTIENPALKEYEIINNLRLRALKANTNKTEFLSNISHELRTPLTSIITSIDEIKSRNIPQELKENINDIIDSSNSLLDIVGNVIEINKIENKVYDLKEKNYDIRDAVEKLIKLNTKKYSKENVVFKYSVSDNTPSNLFGDKTKIKEIINNILDNSFKYTNKGSISLTINSVLDNDICNLIIEIKDTGIGIKSEDLNKIFNGNDIDNDINSSVNRDGLGLLISKDLVNLLNGTISVNSYYGSGSVFTIKIPQKLKNELEIVEQTNTTKFNNKKVLLVDDDRLNNRILKRLLKIYGIELDTCERGIECIDKINNGEQYDLILMDIMMPDINGVDTLKKLKSNKTFNTKVIALTADALSTSRNKYLKAGFTDYLAKPFKKEELEEKLKNLLGE